MVTLGMYARSASLALALVACRSPESHPPPHDRSGPIYVESEPPPADPADPAEREPERDRCDPLPKVGEPCDDQLDSWCVVDWGERGGWSTAMWCRKGRWEREVEANLD